MARKKGSTTVKKELNPNGSIKSRIRYRDASWHVSPGDNNKKMKSNPKKITLVAPHDSPQMWPDGDWEHRRTVQTGDRGHH